MNVTGIMIYYYFICHRRLWYFANQINMEQNSELVEIGKIIDETTYSKEKTTLWELYTKIIQRNQYQ